MIKMSRMTTVRTVLAIAFCGLLAACTTSPATTTSSTAASSSAASSSAASSLAGSSAVAADPAEAAAVIEVVKEQMTANHLRSVIVRVTKDGQDVVTAAFGDSMTGVPATTDMHFRNGAVAISYVATVLLQLVDEGKVSLDDKLSKWLPDQEYADQVTLGQLARMTSGIPDYVQQPELAAANYTDPFKQWTPEELLSYVAGKPLIYPPGTNWNYSHSNYVILGLALEKITGEPVDKLIQDRVLDPLGLDNTTDPGTAAITEPVLHTFTSERRAQLGIAQSVPFYEESTFWNPSWTITRGAIQTTNIYDMTATAVAVGEGTLLSPASHQLQVSTDLRGFGSPVEGCATCFTQSVGYSYGVGQVTTGNWTLQNPMFSGFAGAEGYLASEKLAVAVAVTFAPEAFDGDGLYTNQADALWRQIGARLVPNDPPPIKN